MHYETYLNLFCSLSCLLFIVGVIFKQQNSPHSALESGTFKFQVSKKLSFKIHELLKGFFYYVNKLL